MGCGKNFTTYEAADLSFIKVKTEGARNPVPYVRAVLFSSVYEAFLGIEAKDATIAAVTDTIEAKILDLQRTAITGKDISGITLITLKHFNTAAFLRYLSQHARITGSRELKALLKKTN